MAHHLPSTTGEASCALSLRGLCKSFGMLKAVDDVGFDVATGAIQALIGPNGAGKSTVFNLVAGVLAPDAGDVRSFGQPLVDLPPHERARAGLARTFQNPFPFPNMTVLENVLASVRPSRPVAFWQLALSSAGARREEQEMHAQAHDCLRTVGLHELADIEASTLTAGQQRLLAIARAIALRPRLLLLDEPAAGLNDTEKGRLADLVRALRTQGMTVLLIEHSMDFVMSLAERIVVLDHGRKLAEGSPREIVDNQQVVAAYLGVD